MNLTEEQLAREWPALCATEQHYRGVPGMTPAQIRTDGRRKEVAVLLSEGVSITRIAERLGVNRRTITADVAEMRQEAGEDA